MRNLWSIFAQSSGRISISELWFSKAGGFLRSLPEGRGLCRCCVKLHNQSFAIEDRASSNLIHNVASNGGIRSGKHERLREAINSLDGASDEVDLQTFACLAKECTNLKALSEGKRLHAYLQKVGLDKERFLAVLLLVMYGKCGDVGSALSVFDKIPKKNVILWTALIGAYAGNGLGQVALKIFYQMQQDLVKPNKITFITVLNACCSPADLSEGQKIHAQIVRAGLQADMAVKNALVTMYGKCGSLDTALKIFEERSERDVISWTAMIAAYAQNKHAKKALKLFHCMVQEGIRPNKITLISIANACAAEASVETGKVLHSFIDGSGFATDLNVGNALIHMYGKFGEVESCRRIFDRMPQRDVISWTAMISALAVNECGNEAIEYFHSMKQEGLKPNKITFMSVLDVCGRRAALQEGKLIHAQIVKSRLIVDVALATTIINMYNKCGALKHARRVFDKTPAKDLVLWNTMLSAYSHHGLVDDILLLFRQMQQENVKPDGATYISVLTACSHAGLVDDGIYHFRSMKIDHSLEPLAEHYGCLIDILGRAGRLDDAEKIIITMPFQPSPVIWMTLLGACSLHGDLERAKRAASMVIKLDPQNSGPYVILTNMLAAETANNLASPVRT